jgi:GMC oxidoreductase
MATKICIIGCGTYGAYLMKGLSEKYGNDIAITSIEIGDEKIKNESEIGLAAESGSARAAQQGRYFGLGGTSARWGGQVLFFDERDNPKQTRDWDTIVKINHQYRRVVLQKLLGNLSKFERLMRDKGNEKTGIWLKYTRRNMFKALDKSVLKSVNIVKNHRVIDFVFNNSKIEAVLCQSTEGSFQTIDADIFYLTAGAIESCRLLLDMKEKYGMITSTDLGKHYGDHLSVELFKIKHRPTINGTDFLPRIVNGSLVTKRWVVIDKSGKVGFAHPIFNKEVRVFTSIKRLLFGKQQVDFSIKDVFEGLEFLVRFGFSVLFLKKMYAHRNTWSLQLEIEQAFPNDNSITLSEQTDKFGQKVARLNWQVRDDDRQAIDDIKADLMQQLDAEKIDYTVVYDPNIEQTKIEDVYHPAGFIRLGHDDNAVLDTDCRVKGIDNLYHFSTAMFPSVKSASPTAAAFCFIEHHLATFDVRLKTSQKIDKSLIQLALHH